MRALGKEAAGRGLQSSRQAPAADFEGRAYVTLSAHPPPATFLPPPAPACAQEADTWVARSKYTLEVQTCDLNGADFEGRAYVTLSGYWGTTKEVKLCKPGATSHRWVLGLGF